MRGQSYEDSEADLQEVMWKNKLKYRNVIKEI